MHQARRAFQSLDKVRLQSIPKQCCHGSFCVKIPCRNGTPVKGAGNLKACKPSLQIRNVPCQAEHGHDLAGSGNVKAIFPRHAVSLSTKTGCDLTKLPVIHIQAAAPRDLSGINAQLIPLLNMIVYHGRQQIIRRCDRMQIPRKVEVDAFHGQHLGISAAGGTALHAEHRAKAWFTQRQHRLFPASAHAICQSNADSRFSFACRRRVDGRHQNQLCLFFPFRQQSRIHFCHQPPIKGQSLLRDACLLCNFANRLGYCRLSNFQISCHAVHPPSPMPHCQAPDWAYQRVHPVGLHSP